MNMPPKAILNKLESKIKKLIRGKKIKLDIIDYSITAHGFIWWEEGDKASLKEVTWKRNCITDSEKNLLELIDPDELRTIARSHLLRSDEILQFDKDISDVFDEIYELRKYNFDYDAFLDNVAKKTELNRQILQTFFRTFFKT